MMRLVRKFFMMVVTILITHVSPISDERSTSSSTRSSTQPREFSSSSISSSAEERSEYYQVDHHPIKELGWHEMQEYWACHEIYYNPNYAKMVSRDDWETLRRVYRSFMKGSPLGRTPKRNLHGKGSILRSRALLRVAPARKHSHTMMRHHHRNQHLYRRQHSRPVQPSSARNDNGFEVPIDVELIEWKGRGVFAREPIAKGSLIWSSQYTAKFESYAEIQRFLLGLPNDRLRCDVLQWAYDREQNQSTAYTCVDLDEGSLVNSIVTENTPGHYSLQGLVNAEMFRPDQSDKECPWYRDCELQFFASVDIHAGAEILLSYDEFETGRLSD